MTLDASGNRWEGHLLADVTLKNLGQRLLGRTGSHLCGHAIRCLPFGPTTATNKDKTKKQNEIV